LTPAELEQVPSAPRRSRRTSCTTSARSSWTTSTSFWRRGKNKRTRP
jgi:hypothetical protein